MYNVYKEWREPSFKILFIHVTATYTKKELDLFNVMDLWIWKNRNEGLFGNGGISSEQVVIKAHEWIQYFEACSQSQEVSIRYSFIYFYSNGVRLRLLF